MANEVHRLVRIHSCQFQKTAKSMQYIHYVNSRTVLLSTEIYVLVNIFIWTRDLVNGYLLRCPRFYRFSDIDNVCLKETNQTNKKHTDKIKVVIFCLHCIALQCVSMATFSNERTPSISTYRCRPSEYYSNEGWKKTPSRKTMKLSAVSYDLQREKHRKYPIRSLYARMYLCRSLSISLCVCVNKNY